MENINLQKNYTLKVVEEIFYKQILYDNQYEQGIQKENEINLQQQINYASYIFYLPVVNFIVGLLLSEVCDYDSGIS